MGKLKIRLVSKHLGSNSLKALAQELSKATGYKVFRSNLGKSNRNNITYGDGKDKVYQYNWFQQQGVPALEFTTSIEKAREWCKNNQTVFARTLTKSSEGKGIVVAETPEQVPMAPVYTLYKKKKKEFRVHVFQSKVVAVLEKRRKKGAYTGESKIRNTANGYVFCRENVEEPSGIRELAIAASKVTASDFKGVDIGYNEKLGQLFVIEVNSAPGMEGTTVLEYVKAITNA